MSEIWAQAAKSKRSAGEDAPVRQPMRPAAGIRQAPSTDQKKVRRAMSRGVNKSANLQEEPVMSDTQREAALLRAMAKATPAEQMRLAAELEDLRGQRVASLREDRAVDLGSTVATAHLTPVATYGRNTSGTDWIETVATFDGDATLAMKTAATRWFGKVSAEVKADREEFGIQAQGAARRQAGAYGDQMAAAERAFLDQVSHLYRTEAKTASVKQADYNGYTNWDTWNADLWLSNDQALYNACSRAIDSDEIRQIYQAAVDSGVITDDIDADAVNWDEVYATFHADDHLGARKHANDEVDPQNGHADSMVPEVTVHTDTTPAFNEGWASGEPEITGVHQEIPGASTAAKTAAAPDLDAMMAWEDGTLDEDGTIALFQSLIDSGLAWSLQGAYGRQAQALIDAGLCTAPGATAARKVADADAKYRWDDGDGHTDMQPASAFENPSNGWSAERDEDNDEWIVKTPSGVTRRYQRYPYTTSASRKTAASDIVAVTHNGTGMMHHLASGSEWVASASGGWPTVTTLCNRTIPQGSGFDQAGWDKAVAEFRRLPNHQTFVCGRCVALDSQKSSSRKQANDAVDPQNGYADSSLPEVTVHTNTDPAFPWEIDETTGKGSADVADTHTPGQGVADYPQPKGAARKTADLDSQMEFDHVVQVDADGTVTDAPSGLYAPEITLDVDDDGSYIDGDESAKEQARAQGWELLGGFSGQYGFGSDDVLMHQSESVGGGLEQYILSHPGYYVVTTANIVDGSDPENWVIAFKPLGTTAARVDLTNPVTAAFRARVQASLRQNR